MLALCSPVQVKNPVLRRLLPLLMEQVHSLWGPCGGVDAPDPGA